MRHDLTGLLKPIAKSELTVLLKETKETLASAEQLNNSKPIRPFTVIDLWNARRRSTAALQKRRYL